MAGPLPANFLQLSLADAPYFEGRNQKAMAHDPVANAALGPLREMLQRYLQVVDVLNSAVEALAEQQEPGTETTGRPRQATPEPDPGDRGVEKREEMQTILAFQERLSEVLGVATVTLEGSSDSGFRFLVEMDIPPC